MTLTEEDPKEIALREESGAVAILRRAEAVTVVDDIAYGEAGGFVLEAKAAIKRGEEWRTRLVKPLNDHVAQINVWFKAPAETLKRAVGIVTEKMTAYQEKVEAKRRVAQRIHQEEIRRLQERAAKAEEKGQEVKAATLQAQASVVAAEDVKVEAPKVSGLFFRTTWRCRIVDPALVPRDYCVPDHQRLNSLAKSQMEQFRVPGCVAYAEKSSVG